MPTFDGEALIITLDPVVDGVLDVDVGDDLYTQWKTWMKEGNMRYPAAFRTTGGDELTSIINAGSYFFLRNDYGWRMKSFENNGTYFLVGNLAAQTTALPVFNPTDGTFTAAILGLQPVTQGVTPAMADQLAFVTFQGSVHLNIASGYAGTGNVGSDEIGTRKAPSNNSTDTLAIAVREGLDEIHVGANMTLNSNTDWSDGYHFIGDRPQIQVTFASLPDITNCALSNMTIFGEMDGVNTIRDCSVGTITNVSGFVDKCAFFGDVTLNGDINIFQSYSQKSGLSYITINSGAHEVQVSDWHRSLGIAGMTAGEHTIELYAGTLHIEASCTGGIIHVRGNPVEVIDLSGAGCTVLLEPSKSSVYTQEIRDSMKLAPTAGSPAAGSVDQHLDDLIINVAALPTPAEVNAELVDVMETDTHAEPTAAPAAISSYKDAILWVKTLLRNKLNQTSALTTLRNDTDSADISTSIVSDDGSTFTRGKHS